MVQHEQPGTYEVELLDLDGGADQAPGAPAVFRAYTGLSDAVTQVRERRATPGYRPGRGDRVGQAARLYGRWERGEIVTPVLIRPDRAMVIVANLLEQPVPGIRIDGEAKLAVPGAMGWHVVVRTSVVSRCRAQLTLRSSPSANLTVLELAPSQLCRLQRQAFVRVGVVALAVLAERLTTCRPKGGAARGPGPARCQPVRG